MEQLYQPDLPQEPAGVVGRSVSLDQAMQLLGVSKRTVYYWIRQGRLRTVRTQLGSQRVLIDSIQDLVVSPPAGAPRPVSAETLRGYRW